MTSISGILPYEFGRYRLLGRIAVGGMAELFRGAMRGMEGFEKIVAVKRILPHLTDQQDLVKAFISEAKLAAQLQHANIVPIYDFGSIEGAYFIAMEYLSGKDLSFFFTRAKEKNLPVTLEHALYITAQVCQGLDYAHNLKDLRGCPLRIIHRDISPPNVFITYEGEVKIVDFGVAKAADMNTKTREGVIKGKVCYMSPEQASGLDIDHRSDLFSAGVLLYEMLTGQRMFTGDPLHTLLRVREADFQPPEDIAPDLPPPVHRILHRALAKDPDLRYAAASEMLRDIEAFFHESGLRPSARTLARYARALFADEIALEEEALYEGSNASLPGPKTQGLGQEKAPVQTALMTVEMVPKTQTQHTSPGMLFPLLAVALFIAGFWALSSGRESFSALYRRISPSSGEVSASFAAVSPYAAAPSQSVSGGVSETKAVHFESKPPQLETALSALDEKRFDIAAGLFQELLTSRPEFMEDIRLPYASALKQWAMSIKNKDPEKAAALLEHALELAPDMLRAHFELAAIYSALGHVEKAIQTYEKIAEKDPPMAEALFNLAYLHALTKDYRRAEFLYRRVADLSPPYLDEVLFNLAVVQKKQGKRESSVESLKKALAFNPKNEPAKAFLRKTSGGPS